jgi:ribonuclease BN (tRNA processing enzyme)
MKIKILGTKGEIKPSSPYHTRHSGTLINGELLLDCGEKEFFDYDPLWILLTHLHPDHAVFLRETLQTDIPIYGPEPYMNCVLVRGIRTRLRLGSYTIFPIPTLHSQKVLSQGYLIRTKDCSLLYTGDLYAIKTSILKKYAPIDIVITEASFIRKGGLVKREKRTGKRYGHTGVPDLLSLFSSYTRIVLLIHFGSWFYHDTRHARRKLSALGSSYGMKVISAYDGLTVTLKRRHGILRH